MIGSAPHEAALVRAYEIPSGFDPAETGRAFTVPHQGAEPSERRYDFKQFLPKRMLGRLTLVKHSVVDEQERQGELANQDQETYRKNLLAFKRLEGDLRARSRYVGRFVGIVDGNLVQVDAHRSSVIHDLRKAYPEKQYFVGFITKRPGEHESIIFDADLR